MASSAEPAAAAVRLPLGSSSPAPVGRGAGLPAAAWPSAEDGATGAVSRTVTPRGRAAGDGSSLGGTSSPVGLASNSGSGGGYTPPRQRLGVGAGAGGRVTPIMHRVQSNVSPIAVASARGQLNDSMVNLVRREVEHAEGRLKTEISRLRETVAASLEKMDRVRESATQRLEQKVVNHESSQCKLDRKVSELCGAVRGLSDEMQLQIRRADVVDSRLWEFRHQLEEGFQKRCAELESQIQEAASKSRVLSTSCEEAQKRLQQTVKRQEEQLHELVAQSETMDQAISNFQERLTQVEDDADQAAHAAQSAHDARHAKVSQEAQERVEAARAHESDARLWQIEQQVADIQQKTEQLGFDAHGDRGWDARLEEHEVRMSTLRSKLESMEEHYQSFDERSRTDWESKFLQVQKSVQDMVSRTFDDNTRIETLMHRTEGIEQALEEFRSDAGFPLANVQGPYLQAALEGDTPEPYFGLAPPASNSPADAQREDLINCFRERIHGLQELASSSVPDDGPRSSRSMLECDGRSETPSMGDRADDLEARLNLLIEKLKDVVPKVVEHDNILKSLPLDDLGRDRTDETAAAKRAAEAAELAAAEAKAAAQDAVTEVETWKLAVSRRDDLQPAALADSGRGVDRAEVEHMIARLLEVQRTNQEAIESLKSQLPLRGPTDCAAMEQLGARLADVERAFARGEEAMGSLQNEVPFREAEIQQLSMRLKEVQRANARGEEAIESLKTRVEELAMLIPKPGLAAAEFGTEGKDEISQLTRRSEAEEEVQRQLQAQAELLENLQGVIGSVANRLDDLRTTADMAARSEIPSAALGSRESIIAGLASQLLNDGAGPDLAAVAAAVGLPTTGGVLDHDGADGHPVLDEELTGLFSRVEESETAVSRIQQQLNLRIKKMDELLDSVSKDVCRDALPNAAAPAALLNGASLHADAVVAAADSPLGSLLVPSMAEVQPSSRPRTPRGGPEF